MRDIRRAACALLTLGLAGLWACNQTPVAGLEKSFTFKVEKRTGDDELIKVDFLWVIDNSSSMCEEQLSLTRNFRTFTDQIQNAFDIDPRVAVTTVDAQCEVNNTTVFSARGKFNQRAATAFPPPCQEQRKVECLVDADCAGLDCELYPDRCANPQGTWTCSAPTSETCLISPNGSVNSSCKRRCKTDGECQTLFGDATFVCQKPSSNEEDWGCIRPPDSASCPNELPPFLDSNNLDLFPCIATVGVNQEKCLKFEQQLRSGYMALDPNGPNAAQSQGFLRDDAYLVVIFVSDEEDCSIADNATVSEDKYETCGLLKTTDQGGPLVPVAHYVNRFKALKADPGRVIVAAISGDSQRTEPAEITLEREAYVEAKSDPRTCFQKSYICSSANGTADFGSRFLDFTRGFGPNGTFSNICADAGIGPALAQVAQTIVAVINKICLPRPILDGLVVKRIRNGVEETLVEGDGPGTYAIVRGAEDCAVDGVIMPAVTFGDPPIPGEEIRIEYQGDPQFGPL
jgi:hypothetical protein